MEIQIIKMKAIEAANVADELEAMTDDELLAELMA